MIQALYHRHPFQHFRQATGSTLLEAAVAKALLDGELTAGDQIAAPNELGKRLGMTPSEVLDSISHLLSQSILQQDEEGNLFIDGAAVPSREISQQAFALRSSQLRESARYWNRQGAGLKDLLRGEQTQVA